MASDHSGRAGSGRPSFQAFAEHVEEGAGFKEITYDLQLLASLAEPDRACATELLIDRVANGADALAAETLAAIGAVEAVPVLQQVIHHPNRFFTMSVNRALVALTGSAAAESRVADAVLSGPPLGAVLGLGALSERDSPDALRGLLDGLEAPFKPARIQALDALQERFGVVALAELFTSPLWTLSIYLLCDFPSMIAVGAQGLRETFVHLAAGATPAELDLEHQLSQGQLVERVRASLHDGSPEIDVDGIRAMTGDERGWAEAQLVYNLSDKDPRAARAIGRLGLGFARPALQDALKSFDGPPELIDSIEAAIAELDSQPG